jgi:UDP-glucose 4-epimerase
MSEGLAGARVVVTGGLGLIGSHLVDRLAETAGEVVALDALVAEHGGRAGRASKRSNVRVVVHDLRERRGLDELLDGVDVVFNLAGQRSHTDAMRDPLTDLEHNCRAQLTLLESCRRSARPPLVIFASTRQVYGRAGRAPVDESVTPVPVDVNGIHKLAAERYHRLYHEVHGVPAVVLRLTNTYGPGMRICDARQGFLGVWIDAVLRDRSFEVWDGAQRRDFTYVDDAVDAFIRAGSDPRTVGGTFNLGGESATLLGVAERLVAVAGAGRFSVVPMPADAVSIDIGDYTADDKAFRALTGWSPRVALDEGLRRTIDGFRQAGASYWDAA